MFSLMPELNQKSSIPLYIQLYQYIKESITSGQIKPGDKLPSLRNLSKALGISITTVSLGYNQLLVEGYIESRKNSGYYAKNVSSIVAPEKIENESYDTHFRKEDDSFIYDLSCFDFNKWKKCSNKIFSEYPHLLLSEGDPQGEYQLRLEISKYIYSSRGVNARPDQIIIGAGTQQITVQLSRILSKFGIGHIAVETPGYTPVYNIFEERNFAITRVPVKSDGIFIERLPENIKCAAYVNPSNQFPTGAVMPAGRRHELLNWAKINKSYIIEDDYDSELRYFGRPVPAIKGIDESGLVIYLGSFSSTLYPSIKISYMILPQSLKEIFEGMKSNYTQTCSKAEQLTLSLFMNAGYYQTNIRKLRSLYSRKLQKIMSILHGNSRLSARHTYSGVNMILDIKTQKSADKICAEGKLLGLNLLPLDEKSIIFYYNQIPLDEIEKYIDILLELC